MVRQNVNNGHSGRTGKNILPMMLFFPISILFQELITRANTFGELKFGEFCFIFLYSVSIGFILSFIISLMHSKRAIKVMTIVTTTVLSVLYSAQVVYYEIFKSYFSWESVGMAGEAATDFFGQLTDAIAKRIGIILLLFVPHIFLIFFHAFIKYIPRRKTTVFLPMFLLAISAFTFTVASFAVSATKSSDALITPYSSYMYPDDKETVQCFGILTSTRLNISKIIFGGHEQGQTGNHDETVYNPFEPKPKETDKPSDTATPGGNETEPPEPIEYGDNVMDIDFDKLIANAPNDTIKGMHQYFASRTPTKKNKYTGMFKGKNLIMMTLEGFSGKVIDPELTPMLYKMSTEGFVFNNYYCSCWGGSTATGEYANMTGNFYNKASCLKTSGSNYLPFCLGTQFSKIGYTSLAYHGHTYTYYSRDVSHPNMGYNYIGVGNGIEKLTDREGKTMNIVWPNSDLEVAKVTIDQYIDKQPFHVYYMTISGHANYNWGGNNMSKRNRAKVQDLPYSEEIKAYIACQLELEYMLEELVKDLDEAGILENTVFVMAADHYPYAITTEAGLAELYNLPETDIHKNFELYKNSLILWCADMKKPIIVDTPCSAIDVLPTVSNLFGLEYDSRLLMGTDVLSDTDPVVILNCDGNGTSWNWINRYGTYNSSKGFTASKGYEADASAISTYVKQMNAVVSNMRTYSYKILTEDYYKYVFGK